MRSGRYTVVAVMLAAVVPAQAAAQDGFERFQLFNECAPIVLVVQELDDDAASINLTVDRIQTVAESRLRAARMYDAGATAYVFVEA